MKIRKSDRRYVVKKSFRGNSNIVDLANNATIIKGADFAWATRRCNYLNWQNLINHAFACQEDNVAFKGKFL